VVAALGAAGNLTGGSAQLVLVGSGGFGRETAEAVRAINESELARAGHPCWDLLGFLDDDEARWGEWVSGTEIIGGLEKLDELPEAQLVVCTGHPGDYRSKKRIVERLGLPRDRYATLIHPAAVVPESCRPQEGTVILAGTVATTDVEIGAHVAVMPQAVLTHDCRLEDFTTLGAAVCLAGRVHVEEGAYLGAGCQIRGDLNIGSWALVGMGSVVLRDVPVGETWAGVPARQLRPR
jgi:sugar O-acyltransferase (sialic acid O-acetyltransferase NeuD family)